LWARRSRASVSLVKVWLDDIREAPSGWRHCLRSAGLAGVEEADYVSNEPMSESPRRQVTGLATSVALDTAGVAERRVPGSADEVLDGDAAGVDASAVAAAAR